MEKNKFDLLLEKVHEAIQNTDRVDEKGRELLEDLGQDIQDLLNRSGMPTAGSTVDNKLREAISHFETSHPTLTTLLAELSSILSNAGI